MSDALQQQLEKARAARAQLTEHERLQALAGQVENLELLQQQEASRLQGQALITTAFVDARAMIDAARPALQQWNADYARVTSELAELIERVPLVQAPLLQAANDLKRAAREAQGLGVLVDERDMWRRAGGTDEALEMVGIVQERLEFKHHLANWIVKEKHKFNSTRLFTFWQGGNWSLSQFFR